METNNHFGFAGLPSAPTASGLKPTPASGDSLYANGAPTAFPPPGKGEPGPEGGPMSQAPPACSPGLAAAQVSLLGRSQAAARQRLRACLERSPGVPGVLRLTHGCGPVWPGADVFRAVV